MHAVSTSEAFPGVSNGSGGLGKFQAIYMFGGVILSPEVVEPSATQPEDAVDFGTTSEEESDGECQHTSCPSGTNTDAGQAGRQCVTCAKRRSRGCSRKQGRRQYRTRLAGVAGDATPTVPWNTGKANALALGHTRFVSECQMPTDKGAYRLRAYRYDGGGGTGGNRSHEPVAMVAGDISSGEDVHVRIHDQCQTSEVLGSMRCDCREQLNMSLQHIQEHGGAVIYLQQEGRGIGLANKVAAYALQDGGLDTVDANRRLGFDDDQRSYECVAFILQDMGIKSVQLMTNNPYKIEWLQALGINVTGRIPVVVPPNPFNERYLKSKVHRMSHLINNL